MLGVVHTQPKTLRGFLRSALKFLPALLAQKVSIDIAERNGAARATHV
jgi:hypothetical protein